MNESTIKILFSILSAELKGKELSESEKVLCTDDAVLEVLKIAQKHDIAHLICTSLLENKLLPDNAPKYQSFLYKAIYRYEKQNCLRMHGVRLSSAKVAWMLSELQELEYLC